MKLAVVFPGLGYHKDKPLLYYGQEVLKEVGYDRLDFIDYGKLEKSVEKDGIKAVFEELYVSSKTQLDQLDYSHYEEVVFLSKSIGTCVSACYVEENDLNVKQVLYTPIELTYSWPIASSIAFVGDKDDWSNFETVVSLSAKTSVPLFTYHGANHSLKTRDTLESLDILKDVITKTKEFLK